MDYLKIDEETWSLSLMTGEQFYQNIEYLPDPVKRNQEMSSSKEFEVYHFRRNEKTCKDKMIFVCKHGDCDLVFWSMNLFFNHIRSHVNEKPFTCNHPGCGKAFGQNSNLLNHMLIHENVKRYQC